MDIKLAYYEPANDFAGTFGYPDCGDNSLSVWDQSIEFWEKDEQGRVLDELFAIYDDVHEQVEEINLSNIDNDSLVDPEKEPNG